MLSWVGEVLVFTVVLLILMSRQGDLFVPT